MRDKTVASIFSSNALTEKTKQVYFSKCLIFCFKIVANYQNLHSVSSFLSKHNSICQYVKTERQTGSVKLQYAHSTRPKKSCSVYQDILNVT